MPESAAPPMLALLERFAGYALARRPATFGPVTVTGVTLARDTIEVELVASGLTFLMDGRYRAEARIEATAPDETRCTVALTQGRTTGRVLGRLAQAALGALPDAWINPLLAKWLPGTRREGAAYVVSHRALARMALRREPIA
jgi:hypothetical protein